MATDKSQFVDLFGNTTLTPRQIAQQQIAESIRGAEQSFSGASVPTRSASAIGAGVGGLFRQVLMDTGVIDKDPRQAQAEKLSVAREAIIKDAKDKGVELSKDPEGYTALAVKHFSEAGMEEAAFKALQVGQLFQAQKRAAALEDAKLKQTEAETNKALAEADKNKAEAGILPAKLAQLQSSTELNKTRAAGLKVLTELKKTDPNRAKVQKFVSILTDLETRQKKDPNAKFTSAQQKVLDALHKADPINRLLGQAFDGSGGTDDANEVFDFTATP